MLVIQLPAGFQISGLEFFEFSSMPISQKRKVNQVISAAVHASE